MTGQSSHSQSQALRSRTEDSEEDRGRGREGSEEALPLITQEVCWPSPGAPNQTGSPAPTRGAGPRGSPSQIPPRPLPHPHTHPQKTGKLSGGSLRWPALDGRSGLPGAGRPFGSPRKEPLCPGRGPAAGHKGVERSEVLAGLRSARERAPVSSCWPPITPALNTLPQSRVTPVLQTGG